MRARSLLLPFLTIALGVTGSVVGPRSVRADVPAPPPPAAPGAPGPQGGVAQPAAVDRLTAEELEILRRRFPDWDQRDAAERERIASNVMRLRNLSPEDRRRLLERAKKLELAGPDAVTALAQKLRGWHEMSREDQEQMREKRLFFRGMGAQVVGVLPVEARRLVTPGALPTSLTFPERLRLEVGIASLLSQKIVLGYAANPPLDAEPSPGASPAQSQRLTGARDALRRAGAAATEEERRRFAKMLFEDRLLALRRRLAGGESDEVARGERFGALAKEAFPEAFAAVVDGVTLLAAKGRDGLLPLLAEGAESERGAAPAQRPLVELVIWLERARPALALVPGDLAAEAQAFQGKLLVALGWKPEAVRLLAESRTEQERWPKLAVFKRWFSGGAPPGRWGGGGRRGPGFGPGQGLPGGGRPGDHRGGPPPAPPEIPAMDAAAPAMEPGAPGAAPEGKPSDAKPPEPGPSVPR